eukprot:8016862-Pyramimonas_sp.AAC.1
MGPRSAVLSGWKCQITRAGRMPKGHETLYWVGRTHVATPTGSSYGALDGATKRCTECDGRTWPPPLGPSVELPVGPRTAALCVADACGR